MGESRGKVRQVPSEWVFEWVEPKRSKSRSEQARRFILRDGVTWITLLLNTLRGGWPRWFGGTI